ncbi:LytTR family DNA-binding domain-containing protein [Mucilaginibacter sp. UR6-1]|uniref:LytR/AlgR family response regulator transcription factor n=1 Tax=Mucilaginibacter sp. UR6-1 TaxID=1435643 RepID=UPI001E35B3AD|nr:LytTR family DNA-binding domain-containing protein [Mucilaginibacter sp. UR6-1]MCC8408117.1 LytTR family DNA-binding domain-containing protein [Mucilaginibacter sp. UR6-1]
MMNIIIIEDETVVADDLELSLRQLIDEPVEITKLHSVKESVEYLTEQPVADLIFSDIQLGDGISFQIFSSVKTLIPVIFCTAYDDYALDAFKANGIDYILKPFNREMLSRSLQRYKQLKGMFASGQLPEYSALSKLLTERIEQRPASVLVHYQDKIIPVKLDDIALVYLESEVVNVLTFQGKIFFPNKTMEEMEKVAGSQFFRVNRQFIVNRKTIIDVSSFFSRKLSLNLAIDFKERVTVSKGRVAPFLNWLAIT